MREALLAAQVFATVRSQVADSVKVDDMNKLLADVKAAVQEKYSWWFD